MNVLPSLSPDYTGSLYGRKFGRTKPFPNSRKEKCKDKKKIGRRRANSGDANPSPCSQEYQIMNRLQVRNESRRGVKNVAENSTTARDPRPVQERRRFQREAVGGLRHADPWR